MTDKNFKLKGAIVAKCGTESKFATSIGWTRQRLSTITSGKKTANVKDLKLIASGLQEPIGDVLTKYFI